MKTQDSSVPLSPQQDSVTVKPRRKVRPEPAANTTRALLNALATLKSGDFSVRLPLDWVGIAGKVADTFNEVGFSQQACHQGPFDNRRDLEPIDSKEPDPHAAFAKIVFEVYCPRISYEYSLSDFLFPQTPLVSSVTRFRVSLDCQ